VSNTSTTANATYSAPVFDYTSRDYVSVFNDLMARIPLYLPEWTSQSPNDFGIVLLQMFAYVCDLLGYYLDRLGGEAFMATATQPTSIINLAAMLDYQPALSVGASVELQISVSGTLPASLAPVVIPAGTQFSTAGSPNQTAIVFETTESLTIAGPSAATPSLTDTVPAVQGVTHSNEVVATATGAVNQAYPLLYAPVSANSVVVLVDLGLGPQPWTYVQTLINSGPYDQVFTSFVDANGIFYVIFGDGVNGFVPTLGSPITATYQTNVGTVGNVGAQTITQSVVAIPGVVGVTNPLPAIGGANAESLTSIQQNAPASLKTLNRAVTVQDIETLAIQVSQVQWAAAQEVTYQLVNLYVVPFGGGAPSAEIQDAVLNYVGPLTMANTTVTVLAPTYVPVNISVNVEAYTNAGNVTTQTAVTAALADLLALSNVGFGYRVSLGLVYQLILSQPGVNWAVVTELTRSMLTTLTSALVSGTAYTSLAVTPLPQPIASGDALTLTLSGDVVLDLTASADAAAGAVVVDVDSFTPSEAIPLGTPLADTTGAQDCVFLVNEVPTLGTVTVSVSGGLDTA